MGKGMIMKILVVVVALVIAQVFIIPLVSGLFGKKTSSPEVVAAQ